MYDSFVRLIVSQILSFWKKGVASYKEGDSKPISFSTEFCFDPPRIAPAWGNPLEFDCEATLFLEHTEEELYQPNGAVDEGRKSGKDKGPGCLFVEFKVDPRSLPRLWEEIAMDLRDVVRHEVEHLTQAGWSVKKGKRRKDDTVLRVLIEKGLLPRKHYFLLPKEVDAMLCGLYLKAKKTRRPFNVVIGAYLDTQNLSIEDRNEILHIWNIRSSELSLPSPLT